MFSPIMTNNMLTKISLRVQGLFEVACLLQQLVVLRVSEMQKWQLSSIQFTQAL